MMSESMAQTLILVHAVFGGLALLLGAIALVARKGKTIHKRAGKGFYFTMLAAAATALVVSILPNHESPFLFSIGVFSSYFVISGFRSIRFRLREFNLAIDRWLAYGITTTGVIMILYPLVLEGQLNVVLLTFGTVAIVIGARDLVLFKDRTRLRRGWLKLHLGKMVGAYIAAVTAFFVVNQILPGLSNWFMPGIAGGIYIAYWFRRLVPRHSLPPEQHAHPLLEDDVARNPR